jgi:hypothetical protein
MHSLATSFVAAAHQTFPAYLEHGRDSRSRQVLEAVDAYLRRDSTYLAADMPTSQQALTQVSFLGKLLAYIR